MISSKQGKAMLLLALLSLPCQLHAAPPAQFDIDVKELDRHKPAATPKPEKKPAKKAKQPAAAGTKSERPAAQSDYLRYTVKPGDHIFKILMVTFGMSNDAAERLIPEIVRINNISNIKALTVGRTLLIPAKGKQEHAARPAKKGKTEQRKGEGPAEALALPKMTETPKKAETPKMAEPAAPAPARAPAPAPTAPEPAPAPAVAPPAPVAPPVAPVPAAPVVPAAPPVAPAPVAVPHAAAPAAPQAPTWVCSVGQKDSTAQVVDSLLNAISASWSKNRIIQSDHNAPTAFSIRVDRYFEYKGTRYIISIGESDPYNYTLIRLLEAAGYRVLMLSGREDFKTASEKLFKLIGVAPDFGSHLLQGGKQSTGFLIQQDDAGGRRVLITEGAVDPGQKWVMPSGCGAR